MKKKIVEWILQRIAKNAEHGAGLPSERGLFEAPVPNKLKEKKAKQE